MISQTTEKQKYIIGDGVYNDYKHDMSNNLTSRILIDL